MPQHFREEVVRKPFGMTCDVCQFDDPNGFNDFAIDHLCGELSRNDGLRVRAAICDDCLVELLRAHVPGAHFGEGDPPGTEVEP